MLRDTYASLSDTKGADVSSQEDENKKKKP